MRLFIVAVLMSLVSAGAQADVNPATGQAEAGITGTTLTGISLRAPEWAPATRVRLEQDLAIAKAVFAVAPEREDSWIWLGRRYGYMGYYDDAIAVFTAGLERFPDSYKLHRFRGRHRARNRDFDGAIDDYETGLEKMRGIADSFEPDGIPNPRRLTISTYRGNLHYYLGQTSFATGDYERMLVQMELALTSPIALDIDDHRIAAAFWKYLALKQLGRDAKARELLVSLPDEPRLIENESYFAAIRVFSDESAAAEAGRSGDSLARFALGMQALLDGRREDGIRHLESVVSANPLGYWPAEAELARAGRGTAR